MEPTLLELWLIRHGQSTYNATKRIQGQQDSPLSEHGMAQARALQQRIGHMHFDAIYSSDLQRALKTARTVFPNADITTDTRLRERSYGDYEGLLPSELSPQMLADFEAWKNNPDSPIPNGERQSEFWQRIDDWLADLPTTGKIIAFTHGGVVYSLARALFGISDVFGRGFYFSNASITVLHYQHSQDPAHTRYFKLKRANDTAHLENLS